MRLPKLKVIQNEVRDPISCGQRDHCSSCKLYEKNGGRCEGCSSKHREVMTAEFQWCTQECHTCTGYKTNVTAICCRSPLKNMYLDAVTKGAKDWNNPKYKYKEQAKIEFDRKAIFYFNYGSPLQLTDGGKRNLVDHEVIAVNLSSVKSLGKGFFSNDLHDYLCLKKKTKIILTTMTIDDHLERAFEDGFYERPEEMEKVGVSYWMPLAFSAYRGDAKMHWFYQFCKTQICMEKSRPHFVPGYYLHLSFKFDDLILKSLEKIPQVMFNTQFVTADENDFKMQLAKIQKWHFLAPSNVAFWFVGAVTPTIAHNLRKMCGKRDMYFVSGKPLYLAVHGKQLRPDGLEHKLPPHIRPNKLDLIHDNYKVYETIVDKFARRAS